MSKCKCGRELRGGETQCPACIARKSNRWKRITEVVASVVVVVGLVFTLITGKGKK